MPVPCMPPALFNAVPSTNAATPECRKQLEGVLQHRCCAWHALQCSQLLCFIAVPCSNPEYRQQLEGMLQQQVASSGSPAMAEMMQGMDMSPEKASS